MHGHSGRGSTGTAELGRARTQGPRQKGPYFHSYQKDRENSAAQNQGGRDDVKHTRKVEISGRVARIGLSDT